MMERQNLAWNRQDLPWWDYWGTSRVGNFELHSVFLKDDLTYMSVSSHLEREKILLCWVQVAKMAGSSVSIKCSEISIMSISQVVNEYFNQRNDLQVIGIPPVLKNGLTISCFQPYVPPNTVIVLDNAKVLRSYYWSNYILSLSLSLFSFSLSH